MKLWGGMAEAAIPPDMLDASDFRDVPDSQEMFVGSLENGMNVAIIIDLCEPVPAKDLTVALVEHITEAHRMAGSSEPLDDPSETWSDHLGPYAAAGRVDTVKNGELLLVFALFRLPQYHTDVFLTYTEELGDRTDTPAIISTAKRLVSDLISSFKIIDPKLFHNET